VALILVRSPTKCNWLTSKRKTLATLMHRTSEKSKTKNASDASTTPKNTEVHIKKRKTEHAAELSQNPRTFASKTSHESSAELKKKKKHTYETERKESHRSAIERTVDRMKKNSLKYAAMDAAIDWESARLKWDKKLNRKPERTWLDEFVLNPIHTDIVEEEAIDDNEDGDEITDPEEDALIKAELADFIVDDDEED
jgi:hypothetical protein